MSLTKRFYSNHKTIITAENLNDIQDAILELEALAGIVPGEGEATRTICVLNPNGNFTVPEAVALPDGLFWFAKPVVFYNSDRTETFELSGLMAKAGNSWLSYDTGRTGTTDDDGILTVWSYSAMPPVDEYDDHKIACVINGRWVAIDPQLVFPSAEEANF